MTRNNPILIHDRSPSPGLADAIMRRIARTRIVRARVRGTSYAGLMLVAISAFVPVVRYAVGQMQQSGLYDYVSLFFTDSSYAVKNLSQIMLSVVESAPVMGIALSIGILAIVIDSLRRSFWYIRMSRSLQPLHY